MLSMSCRTFPVSVVAGLLGLGGGSTGFLGSTGGGVGLSLGFGAIIGDAEASYFFGNGGRWGGSSLASSFNFGCVLSIELLVSEVLLERIPMLS